MDANGLIGQPLDRVDGRLKVMGRATYAYEHLLTGCVCGVMRTSTIAKGRIIAMDTRAAEASPGVMLVMTHLNSPKLPKLMQQKPSSPAGRVVQVLQDNVVWYSNQPIAVVVADTVENAREAAELIEVRYAPEPHAVGIAAREHEARVAEKLAVEEPAVSSRGDVESGLASASERIEAVYSTPSQVHNPMEPHATIAVFLDRDHLILYDATQGVFTERARLADLFELKEENVRVISPYIGGGFGSKGPAWSHVVLTALAARQLQKPVRMECARPQMFGMLGYRSETRLAVKAGARGDGTLTALSFDTTCLTSRFEEFVEFASLSARMLYSTPNNSTSHRVIKSDMGTPSYMRAPGETPGTFALEAAMDELAHKLKMDPVEFRLKNYAEMDPDKNKPWSSKSLRECYLQGAERFGWSKRPPDPRSMRDGRTLIGWGMATSVYPTRRSPSSALARLRPDGILEVEAGTQDLGTGTYTIMTQIAASTFGLPPGKVQFKLGDTVLPKTPVSGGSQTAASTGSAVYLAVESLREKLVTMAVNGGGSPLSGASSQDLALADGRLFLRSDPSKFTTLAEVVERSGQSNIEAKAEAKQGSEKDDYSMYAFGAQFAEVRVDADLGQIRVSRMVGCFGAGKILNAKTARNQLMGGMIWGIGMALYEDAVIDRHAGRWINNNLAEYHIATNADVGQVEAFWIDEPDVHVNPLGAKGIGEIGITGASAAVANAVFHATGTRIRDLPITVDKLL